MQPHPGVFVETKEIREKLSQEAKSLYAIPFYTQIFNALANWSRYAGFDWRLREFFSEYQMKIIYGTEAMGDLQTYFRETPYWLPIRIAVDKTALKRVKMVWPEGGSIHILTDEDAQFLFEQSAQIVDSSPGAVAAVIKLERETRVSQETKKQQYIKLMQDVTQYRTWTRDFRNVIATTNAVETCGELNEALAVLWYQLETTEQLLDKLSNMECKLY